MKAKLKPYLHWIILFCLILLTGVCGLIFAKVMISPSNHDYDRAVETKSDEKKQKEGTYYVYGGCHGLPLHKEASKYSKVILAIPNKSPVEIITKSHRGYYKIEYQNHEGYVQGRYLLKFNQNAGSKLRKRLANDYPLYYVVNCDESAKIYRRRNKSSKVIAEVDFGYRVRLLEKGRNNYYKVAYKNEIGYISSEYLSKFEHEKE